MDEELLCWVSKKLRWEDLDLGLGERSADMGG